MVQQNAKKMGLKYEARIQQDAFYDIFLRRTQGEKLYINKGMEETFSKPENKKEEAIAKLIEEWHSSEITWLEEELFKQKKRLADAERVLKSGKVTKKAENDQRIATDKIEKYLKDLEGHKSKKITDSDFRIFPMHYVSMLTVDDKGNRLVLPVRYHMRPSTEDASFDKEYFGCYNARFDNLTRVPFWRNSLGKRHGIILVKRFFENVPTDVYQKKFKLPKDANDKKNLVLCFEPDNVEYMIIPMLWDIWQKKGEPTLYSGALITDDPAPEIAEAGHDRTPIFLKESAVDSWLNCRDPKEAKEILMERERPRYSHRVLGVA